MAESLVNFRITSKDQDLYINSERIVGVQNISINKNLGITNLGYGGIGQKTINYIPRGPQSSVVNINSYLINKEFFLPYVTGSQTVNAFLLKNSEDRDPSYSILNGYFSSYSATYSIGQIPTISTSINVVGNAGKISTGSLGALALAELLLIGTIYDNITGSEDWGSILDSVTDSEDRAALNEIVTSSEDWNLDAASSTSISTGLLIPHGGSISLNIGDFQTNRVQSYRIDVNSNKIPVYNMGSRAPSRIDLIYPIDVNCSFTFEVGNYESLQTYDIPQYPVVENLVLTARDYNTNELISTYSFNNLNLISETYSTSVDGNVNVEVSYNAKIYGN